MSYGPGAMVWRKGDRQTYGEVLQNLGNGRYYVRFSIHGDEDRDFALEYVDYSEIEPVYFSACLDELHGRYRPEKYWVPL